jgi:hypothetical protein
MGFKTKTWVNDNPPSLEDDDLNGFKNEFNNTYTSSGQTPSDADLEQTAKAMSIYSAGSDFYIDTGAADAYVLNTSNAYIGVIGYFTGMRVRFIPTNTNLTNTPTINVNSLGVKNIKMQDGIDGAYAGIIKLGLVIELVYNGVDFVLNNKDGVLPVSTATGTGTASGEIVIRLDSTGGDFTYNLPTAANNLGRVYFLKNVALTNYATVAAFGAETIEGDTSRILATRGHLKIMSNGTNWDILSDDSGWITPATAPIFSGRGSMTITGVRVNFWEYKIQANTVIFRYNFDDYILGGVASFGIFVDTGPDLPTPPDATSGSPFYVRNACYLKNGNNSPNTGMVSFQEWVAPGPYVNIEFRRTDNANFTLTGPSLNIINGIAVYDYK